MVIRVCCIIAQCVALPFFITQARTQKKTVYGVQGPGAFYCDVSQAFLATA